MQKRYAIASCVHNENELNPSLIDESLLGMQHTAWDAGMGLKLIAWSSCSQLQGFSGSVHGRIAGFGGLFSYSRLF